MGAPSRSLSAPTGRNAARVLKALVSLLVLTAAVAGLPLLLLRVTPVVWALAPGSPSHLLDRQESGALFLLVLLAVGWLGWIQFTYCTVRETIAHLAGRSWRVPSGMGATQRTATLLVGSILVLLPTSSALAATPHTQPGATAAHVPGQAEAAQPSAGTTTAAQGTSTTSAGAAVYTVRAVRPTESLWAIAEQNLGNGERWRDIAALNEGRIMPDGQVFHANGFLQPGWQLTMPAPTGVVQADVRTQTTDRPATEPAARPNTAPKGDGHVVTVRPGDSLSKIAQQQLGDGTKWPTVFAATKNAPQPHALPEITDPDKIYPGQQVTVPAEKPARPPQADQDDANGGHPTPSPAPEPSHTPTAPDDDTDRTNTPTPNTGTIPSAASTIQGTPSGSPASRPPHPKQSVPAPTAPATPGSASPRTTATASDPDSFTAPSPTSAGRAPTGPATHSSGGPLNLRIVLGAGALLAAAITGALALRRTLQRRRRTPGENIAIATQTSPAEAQLAAAAEPNAAAHLDLALRTLAHQWAQHHPATPPPPVRAALIGPRTVQILPEDPAQKAVAPFAPGTEGWWLLADDAALLDNHTAHDVPAPYPALATIGHTPDGELLLLNLAQVPALLLDGEPIHISEVCISLALELAMAPWAGQAEVVTVGFGDDLPQLLPTTRVTHMRRADHALRDVGERLLEAHQMPQTRHEQAYLMLSAAVLDSDTAWRLADIIDKARALPVGMVAPAANSAPHFPEAETLDASVNGPQLLAGLDIAVTLQRLDHAAYTQITTALRVSTQPAHPAQSSWQDVPREPAPGQEVPEEGDFSNTGARAMSAPEGDQSIEEQPFPALLSASEGPAALHLRQTAEHTSTHQAGTKGGSHPVQTSAPSTTPRQDADRSRPSPGPKDSESKDATDNANGQPHLHAPQIRVLGPVEMDRVAHSGHGPRMAQLAALLYFRPGRRADALCTDMDPVNTWSTSTLNARVQGLRGALGTDPDGCPYLPRRKSGEDPYRLAPSVRCDWTDFLQLAERGLAQGGEGLPDLEQALLLVRGQPFGGRPLPWAEPLRQEMTTRITDIAHTIAAHRTAKNTPADRSAARRAIATGIEADETSEILYRAWIRLEEAAGNRPGILAAITRLQQVNRRLDCDPEPETESLITRLLQSHRPAGAPS